MPFLYFAQYILLDSEAISSKLVVPLEIIIGNVPLRCKQSNSDSPAPLAIRSIDLYQDQ